jgi:outer membrane protein TolC
MKKLIYIFLIICISFTRLTGQSDTLTLMQCLESAQKNAVINAQLQVIKDITDLKIENTRATNLPSLSAYGKAWYQSDAVKVISPTGPDLEIDRFQYNAGLEADQKLFDGSMAKRIKELELANREVELGKVESEKYQLNNQVTDLFFKTVLLEKSLDVIQLKEELLQERVKEMESAFQNGIIKRNDLDKMEAELVLLQQQQLEIEKLYDQTHASLAIITGLNYAEKPSLVVEDSIFLVGETLRPEYHYFEAETQKLENMVHLQKAQNLPKLYAYGQAGYSYPGLNFFENQSDYYYIVGAKLSWTIFNWKQTGREAEIIRKQKDIVETKREDFDQKLAISLDREKIEQDKLHEMIIMDEEIIRQREAISRGSAKALTNGVITSADYLEDLNAEMKARLDSETHKIQLKSSMVRQKLLKGIDLTSF